MGYATSCPGPWKVTFPPRVERSTVAPAAAISLLEASTFSAEGCNRPSVKTGGCSSSSSVSPRVPARTSAASARCSCCEVGYPTLPSLCARTRRTVRPGAAAAASPRRAAMRLSPVGPVHTAGP
eukprot:scaffold297698_cov24-Tisochrysis_lutea.AAC.1